MHSSGGNYAVLACASVLDYLLYASIPSVQFFLLKYNHNYLLQIMPSVIPLTYFFVLPRASAFLYATTPAYEDILSPPMATEALPYTPLATAEDEVGEEEGSQSPGPKRGVALSISDKWRLVQPMLSKYMFPLCKFEVGNF